MSHEQLRRVAEAYADELNRLGPGGVAEWLASVAAESPYWDERTNLLAMAADDDEDLCLVLAADPGGDGCLVLRWAGRWLVDASPVDWEAVMDDPAWRDE